MREPGARKIKRLIVQMPNPRGQQRDKPFRDALRMEAALAEKGELSPAPEGSLRWIARRQLIRAGEETAAAREVADRLDGKVPQAVVGDDEYPPIRLSALSDDELDQLEKLLAAAESRAEPGDGADREADLG